MADQDDLITELDVMVPMRDGTRLRTDIFRPAGGERFPVLLQRYPYSNRDGIMNLFGQQIARQGYVVAIQSCRGRFGSEGEFYPFHPDVDDSYDAVEWAGAATWSTGRVGMYGVSYSGMTQWAAAIARPPHLVCIAPALCTWDWTMGGWYFSPGVLALGLVTAWCAQMTAYEAERRGIPATIPAFSEVARIVDEGGLADPGQMDRLLAMQPAAILPLLERRPLQDLEEFHELAPWFRDFCEHDDPQDPYWQQIDAGHAGLSADLPVLHTAGWYDYFTKGGLQAFAQLTAPSGTDGGVHQQRLIAGPWNHNAMQIRPDADPTVWNFFDFSEKSPTMRFFAHHLGGEVPGYESEPPVRIYVMGENVWRDESAWPLERTEWTSYYLWADGRLSMEPPGDEEPDTYVYDPSDPVPGPLAIGLTYNDPVDLTAIATRADVLTYTSDPMQSPVEITGPVTMELWVSTSAPSTDFTATLIEVFPDGQLVALCTGIERLRTTDDSQRIRANVTHCTIDLAATSVLVKEGHRIRMHVTSSQFPTFELNPNTGRRITDDTAVLTATQQIHHDHRSPSRLILPVIPR